MNAFGIAIMKKDVSLEKDSSLALLMIVVIAFVLGLWTVCRLLEARRWPRSVADCIVGLFVRFIVGFAFGVCTGMLIEVVCAYV